MRNRSARPPAGARGRRDDGADCEADWARRIPESREGAAGRDGIGAVVGAPPAPDPPCKPTPPRTTGQDIKTGQEALMTASHAFKTAQDGET